MEKATKQKPTYWAIFEGKSVRFEGTFTECWNQLVHSFGKFTLVDLSKRDIRIARKA